MGETTAELFRSADILVREKTGFSAACCVVTFDSWTDNRTLDRPGFGEHFLAARAIDAIHVLSRDNDWYQYPEMPAAMACVHAAARKYRRVVTYGSSMGAYAAIRFAGLAGAHCALAMSPQFSIDPNIAPFEFRWQAAIDRFTPLWEGSLALPVLPEAYVVYDPFDIDRKHVDLLAAEFAFTPVALPNAGHTVTGYLLETDLLQPLVLAICRGPLDAAPFVAEARQRRRRSPQYFAVLAERTSLNNPARRIALLQQAVRIAPAHAGCKRRLAGEYARVGRFADAVAMHRESLVVEPGQPDLMWHFSLTLEASGDLPGALAMMEEIDQRTGGAALYRPRLLELRARTAATDTVPDPPPAPKPIGLKTLIRRLLPVRS